MRESLAIEGGRRTMDFHWTVIEEDCAFRSRPASNGMKAVARQRDSPYGGGGGGMQRSERNEFKPSSKGKYANTVQNTGPPPGNGGIGKLHSMQQHERAY